MNDVKDVKKVVLAYSGGLDTSVILKWLQQTSTVFNRLRAGRARRLAVDFGVPPRGERWRSRTSLADREAAVSR